jgi:RNA polymerase sigma-70 factor (ECF subfamily)
MPNRGTIIEALRRRERRRRAMAFSQLGLDAWPARVNGAVGWVSLLDGEVFAVAALTLHNGRMATMDILLEPARLARLDFTDLDSEP